MPKRRRGRFALIHHPAQYVLAAFVGASTIGALLLMLPIATEGPGGAPLLTALFTSTSAVCVTGLAVVDTPTYWSTFGELTILGLVQIGGFGIMTLSSMIILALAGRLGLRQRLRAAAESGALEIGEVRRLVGGVVRLSFGVEAAAGLLLAARFATTHGEPLDRAAYLGLFHAVSAFNNAGFGLYSDSLVGFQRDPVILSVVALTIIVGGLGYPVWVQLANHPTRPRRWSLHAKLTVLTTGVLLVVGTVLLAWFEWTNPATLGPLPIGDSLVNAFFHSVSPRTAGFNSVDMAGLLDSSRLLTEVLMFIGGGSGSTAGGIKVTTFAVLGFAMWAEVRGDPDTIMFRRRVPEAALRQALTVALLAIGAIVVATIVLVSTSTVASRDDLYFEAISAFGTVGLSVGVTPLLPPTSQLVVIGLMLLGRVGPITLFAALVLRERDRLYRLPDERPIVG
ncbi:MAG: TrkH family potassium uptake protein [Acidimicrobiales bacterium]|nr:TrkH family potassium uptake protein [Acidimicrobiales bacterium]